ncbi:MAG: hypothetical protein PCFJNLEI_03992 [Verrucomicrobiae bacterium]|nr:hypothetical protein [Verrucomicrobiae bacterium]
MTGIIRLRLGVILSLSKDLGMPCLILAGKRRQSPAREIGYAAISPDEHTPGDKEKICAA